MMTLVQPATNTIAYWLARSCKSRLNVRVNISISVAAYSSLLSMTARQSGFSIQTATACQS
jgi:hypothetical protein